jgi:hypothetical protein
MTVAIGHKKAYLKQSFKAHVAIAATYTNQDTGNLAGNIC